MSYGRPPPDTESMVSLKVDNLTYRTSPEDLKRAFQKYGEVGDVYIPRDRFSRESRGFAFVRFFDKRDAEDALDSMDGTIMDGRELRVQMARYGRPSEPYRRGPPPRRYGGGGDGGGRYHGRSRSRSRSRSRGRKSRRYSKSRSRSYDSRSRSRSKSKSQSRSQSRSQTKSNRSSRSPTRSRTPVKDIQENEAE